MDLFTSQQDTSLQPLSEVLRPRNLDDVFGQEKTVGQNSKLGLLLRKGVLQSLIIWGPPGTGKTSFALALASSIQAHFVNINATESGVKSLRDIGEQGKNRRIQLNQKTLLFVDEIHRFNKGQQDILLPYIEKGDLILIGATTENPSYELNRALLSRCRVVVFERLSHADLLKILLKIESHFEKKIDSVLQPDALEFLFSYSDGDARKFINSLEILYRAQGSELIDLPDLQELLQQGVIGYDKKF